MNETTLAELRAQHEELSALIDECEALADALDAGRVEPGPVVARVAELRTKLADHNRFEERVLARIDVDDHVIEHRAMHDGLENPITRELRATLARLRHHMAIEERYFR